MIGERKRKRHTITDIIGTVIDSDIAQKDKPITNKGRFDKKEV